MSLTVSLILTQRAEADAVRVLVVQDFEGVAVQVPHPSTLEAVTATVQALIRPLFGR